MADDFVVVLCSDDEQSPDRKTSSGSTVVIEAGNPFAQYAYSEGGEKAVSSSSTVPIAREDPYRARVGEWISSKRGGVSEKSTSSGHDRRGHPTASKSRGDRGRQGTFTFMASSSSSSSNRRPKGRKRLRKHDDSSDSEAEERKEAALSPVKVIGVTVDSSPEKDHANKKQKSDDWEKDGGSRKKEKREKNVEVEVSSDEEGEDLEDLEGKRRALEVVRRCQDVAAKLKSELTRWKGERRGAEGCVDLTSMGDEDGEPTKYNVIKPEAFTEICPGVTLKPYQLVGVNWMYLCHQLNVNGVLADDMGLGKTVQTITFLAFLRSLDSEDGAGPHMVVVPASVLSNWENEFDKFAPDVRVLRYHGSASERNELREDYRESKREDDPYDVILTTYTPWERESATEDRMFFKKLPINYMVLDEGHSIKNTNSQRFRRLKSQPARHRLVLSGTPVQNNVVELLTLLSFLMPEVFDFGNNTEGGRFWEHLKGAGNDDEKEGLKKVRDLFAPFVLRRVKADVLNQLTPKETHVLKVPMNATQQSLYKGILDQHLKWKLRGRGQDDGEAADGTGRGDIRQFLTKTNEASAATAKEMPPLSDKELRSIYTDLRKAANHPLLLRRHFTDEATMDELACFLHGAAYFGTTCNMDMVRKALEEHSDFELNSLILNYKKLRHLQLDESTLWESSKFEKLRELLPELIAEGHRVLLFSQWTKLLDIIEALLSAMEISFLRLDGSTPISERQELIDRFNEPGNDIKVFCLSTRAGGLGINLTSADTVILHDLDWNPELDRQAEDRCHRIGQTKAVTVYKLVTAGTVDEKIYDIQRTKREATSTLLGEQQGGAVDVQGDKSSEGGTEVISSILKEALNDYLASLGNGGDESIIAVKEG